MCFLLFQGFSALFRLFWPLKFPVAPNQHRPFCDLRQEPSNTGPPPLPGALPHTHSKTACRGFKSFCPCQSTCPQALRKSHGLGIFRTYVALDRVKFFTAYALYVPVLRHFFAPTFQNPAPRPHPIFPFFACQHHVRPTCA